MKYQEMSLMRRNAWMVAAVWIVAGAAFLAAFFSGGGPGDFDTDSGRHLAAAAAVFCGFIAWWIGLWATRRRPNAVVLDERDYQIMARAGQATLVVVCLLIFALTVTLWTVYEAAGAVPVGWMWFLAYATVIVAVVTNSVAILVLDSRSQGRG